MNSKFRPLWLSAALLILIAAIPAAAGPPICTPFNDPFAVFCDNFDDGDRTGWQAAFCPDGDVIVNTPGLGGTSHNLVINAQGAQSGTNGCGAEPLSPNDLFISSGQARFVEWRMRLDPAYVYILTEGPSNKIVDLRTGSCCGANGRLLMTIGGDGSARWSVYTNLDSPGTGQESFSGNVNGGNFIVQKNVEYHMIFGITGGQGTNGRIRMWINGTLRFDHSGIQTCGAGTCQWAWFMAGGAQDDGGPWFIDQIRMTTTDISPGGAPSPPANLRAE